MRSAIQSKNTLFSALTTNKKVIRSFGVCKLGVFGSFATGDFKNDSDIDLLVEFDPSQKTYDNFIELSFYLESLLGRKVEIVTPQSLSRYIGPHILDHTEYVAI